MSAKNLQNNCYPAIYYSASELSSKSQKKFYRTLFYYITFLVLISICSFLNYTIFKYTCVLEAFLFICTLFLTIYIYNEKPERYWYAGRAVAESVKTLTWRFISRAEPFNGADDINRSEFIQKLKDITEQSMNLSEMSPKIDLSQISNEMLELRNNDFETRKKYYLEKRIIDQQNWYFKKANYNKKRGNFFFIILIITNVIGLAVSLIRIKNPEILNFNEITITITGGLVSWIQSKKFQELSASYSLAAHEISFVKEQYYKINNEKELSNFIGDAENAFSREHTQWVARRDT